MAIPTDITFHQVDHSDALEAVIREQAEKLARFDDRIVRCEVVVEQPHKSQRHGLPYKVRIHLHVPGNDVIVDRNPGREDAHGDPYVVIHDAFHAARRRLEDHVRARRHEVKSHDGGSQHAKIAYWDVEKEWGWLETDDGRRVYFHRNSVLGDVDALELGSEVRFAEENGEKGPQASTVEPLGDHARHTLPPDQPHPS